MNHTVRLLVVKMVCTSGFLQCPRFFGNTTVHSDPAVLELTRLPLLLCWTQAHARLCARSCVTLQDAVMAVLILDSSMTGSSLMGWSNALHTHFPDDPDAEYEMLERQVLCGQGGEGHARLCRFNLQVASHARGVKGGQLPHCMRREMHALSMWTTA